MSTTQQKWTPGQKYTKRERWMQSFESYVLEALPGHKIEWESPIHFFNIGMESPAAAFKYIARINGEA